MSAPDEMPRDWIFTFGWNQYGGARRHNFIRIRGTFLEAREEMFRRYGRQWSMQYESEDAAGVEKFNLTEVEE